MIDASLEMPDKVRELQIKLYRKAKSEPEFRFYQLYDKVYREDVLLRAWTLAKANQGAPGVDGESFEDIETRGMMGWLNGLGKDLHDKTYQPQPVRRVMAETPTMTGTSSFFICFFICCFLPHGQKRVMPSNEKS